MRSQKRQNPLREDFYTSSSLNWERFGEDLLKKRQQTILTTPSTTCGIKGTTVSFAERKEGLTVSLSTGSVEIRNEDDRVNLKSGTMVKGIKKQGAFSDQVDILPHQITIKTDHAKIQIPEQDKVGEIYFTLQLVNLKTNEKRLPTR